MVFYDLGCASQLNRFAYTFGDDIRHRLHDLRRRVKDDERLRVHNLRMLEVMLDNILIVRDQACFYASIGF